MILIGDCENKLPGRRFYFTFGADHVHKHNGNVLDKDCVALVIAEDEGKARKYFSDIFGLKWCRCDVDKPQMKFFKRGLYKV